MLALRHLAALACGRRPNVEGPFDDLLLLARRLGLVSLLGETLADSGHPDVRRAVASSLLLTARRERLLGLLRTLLDHGATGNPVLIKGGGLVIAGSLTHRDMADLDVVVPAAAIASWRDAATGVGAAWREGRGFEAGAITHTDGMIEVHVALPGFAGNEPGPTYDTLARHAVASPMPDILVPSPQAAREITVQHFVFHHAGETGHALRVLQDLAALEGEPDGDGLDWGRDGVREATEAMSVIVRQIRDGRDDEEPADGYLTALAAALEGDIHPGFSDEVARWLADKPGFASKARLIVRRLFPPFADMRQSADESVLRTIPRYVTRPFRMGAKFLATTHAIDPASAAWRETIEGLKGKR